MHYCTDCLRLVREYLRTRLGGQELALELERAVVNGDPVRQKALQHEIEAAKRQIQKVERSMAEHEALYSGASLAA